jgi:hypothetical protein
MCVPVNRSVICHQCLTRMVGVYNEVDSDQSVHLVMDRLPHKWASSVIVDCVTSFANRFCLAVVHFYNCNYV